MTDNTDQIMELLNRRMKEAEAKFIASPEFQFLRARSAHILFYHGTGELCSRPEWNGPLIHTQPSVN